MNNGGVASGLATMTLGGDSLDLSVGDLANAILENQPGSCWGGQLTGSDWRCDKTFEVCGPHFKHKFCPACQSLGIRVSASRVRMLPSGAKSKLVNGNGGGVWTKLSSRAVVGDKRDRKQLQNETVFFRIVNHTARCEPPWIVIFEGRPLEQEWIPVPPAWISELDHTVHLIIRKGTLVPAASEHQMAGLVHHMPQPASLLPSPAQSPQLSVPFPHFASPLGSPSAQLMTGCGAGSLDHLRRLDKFVRGKTGSSPRHVGQGLPLPPRPPVPTMVQPMYPSPPPMDISPPTMLAPSPAVGGVADGWTSRAPAFPSLPGSMMGRRSTLAFKRTPGATIPASFQPTFQPPASAALPANVPDRLGLPGLSEFEIQVLQEALQAELALRRALAGKAGNEPVPCLPLPWDTPLTNLGVDALLPCGIRQTQGHRVQPADAFASLNPQHLPPPASALSSSDPQHRVQPTDALSSMLWADCPPVLLGRSVAWMRPNQFDQKCPAGKEAGGAPPQVEQVDGSGRALAAAHL